MMMGQKEAASDSAAAYDTAVAAAGIQGAFGDADLLGLALRDFRPPPDQAGQAGGGVPLLDETVLSVTSGELADRLRW
jgi:hypothetical protein